MRRLPTVVTLTVVSLTILLIGCSKDNAAEAKVVATSKLGIRPHGDETIEPDPAKTPADLKKIYDYIDEHIDEHVENLQTWIRQPSISNSGEGIQESAEMVKGFFDKLGCQQSRVYDVGITEYGSPGNPVVYAKCDEGAPKTLLIYWMYDTMPVTQPDAWKVPPFEARLVEQPPFKKVLVARGAVNSKGPQMSELNALMSMKAVMGKLPVNLIFVAEGDEERMSIGLRKFVIDHPDLVQADAMYTFIGWQSQGGGASMIGGSEGCINFELTTSGLKWGRGPGASDIHGVYKRAADSPAWRHIQMLASLVSPDGNTVRVDGFYDNIVPPTAAEEARLKAAAKNMDVKAVAENVGLMRFTSDDPYTILKSLQFGTSFNLDGIFGGNMYAGGAGAMLPNKITSKHHLRYVPNMNGPDLIKKIRAQLDRNGYKDVELKLIGDVPWSKMSFDSDISRSVLQMYDQFNIPHAPGHPDPSIVAGGYWPAYLFSSDEVGERLAPVKMPIVGGSAGMGGLPHAANEYYVIEGAGKVYGMAGAEKSVAAVVYNYAHMAASTASAKQ